MENAVWNGKVIVASEVGKNYEQEKQVRRASGRKQLMCPDPDCKNPILKYCHGEIKAAFFSHLVDCKCDYSDFDRENTPHMREIKIKIYNSFRSHGYHVQMDVKIIERHYTHLLITLSDSSKIAIELGTQSMTSGRMDYLTREYQRKGINIKWLVVSDSQNPVKESDTFFMKRHQLNESKKRDVLVLSWDGTKLMQQVEDKNLYMYKGCTYSSCNYSDIYSESANLESLVIEDGELSIDGFHERYQCWLNKKVNAFQKKIMMLDEEEKALRKQARAERLAQEKKKVKYEENSRRQSELEKKAEDNRRKQIAYMQKVSRGYIPEDVLLRIGQQKAQVRDDNGLRWIKCEICGKVATESEFNSYGGVNHINLGKCNECARKKGD